MVKIWHPGIDEYRPLTRPTPKIWDPGTDTYDEYPVVDVPPTYYELLDSFGASHVWPLNDVSGSPVDTEGGLNMTVTGAPLYQQAGPPGVDQGSMLFSGTAQYLTQASLDLSSATFPALSIGILFRQTAAAGDKGLISDWASNSGQMLYITNANVLRQYYNGTINTAGPAVLPGMWHLAVGTYDTAANSYAWKVYVDGYLGASATAAGARNAGGAATVIGAYTVSSGPFNGHLAGAFVVPSVLTAQNVLDLALAAGL